MRKIKRGDEIIEVADDYVLADGETEINEEELIVEEPLPIANSEAVPQSTSEDKETIAWLRAEITRLATELTTAQGLSSGEIQSLKNELAELKSSLAHLLPAKDQNSIRTEHRVRDGDQSPRPPPATRKFQRL